MLRSLTMLFRSRRQWLFGAAWMVAGCLSPTLPLPPPSNPDVASVSEGLVQLSGNVQPESEVFALNRNTNQISGQYTSAGSYSFTLQAHENDAISLWYVHETLESPPNDFILKLPATTP